MVKVILQANTHYRAAYKAGDIIDVPQRMAERWINSGIARLAEMEAFTHGNDTQTGQTLSAQTSSSQVVNYEQDFTAQQLQEMARNRGIANYDRMVKQELAAALQRHDQNMIQQAEQQPTLTQEVSFLQSEQLPAQTIYNEQNNVAPQFEQNPQSNSQFAQPQTFQAQTMEQTAQPQEAQPLQGTQETTAQPMAAQSMQAANTNVQTANTTQDPSTDLTSRADYYFNNYTVAQLQDFARERNITGFSNMLKADLARALARYDLEQERQPQDGAALNTLSLNNQQTTQNQNVDASPQFAAMQASTLNSAAQTLDQTANELEAQANQLEQQAQQLTTPQQPQTMGAQSTQPQEGQAATAQNTQQFNTLQTQNQEGGNLANQEGTIGGNQVYGDPGNQVIANNQSGSPLQVGETGALSNQVNAQGLNQTNTNVGTMNTQNAINSTSATGTQSGTGGSGGTGGAMGGATSGGSTGGFTGGSAGGTSGGTSGSTSGGGSTGGSGSGSTGGSSGGSGGASS